MVTGIISKYRKDVIDNPEYQAKYKAETGKELRVPQTWKEYAEIASFFNGWDWDNDGELEYGSAEVMKKDDLMYAAFYADQWHTLRTQERQVDFSLI